MTNILVTGGAGFIGFNLVRRLAKMGCDVTVLDDMTTGTPDAIPLLPNVKTIVDTVTDRGAVERAVKGKSVIFHLAARNIVSSVEAPHADAATNILGTLNVLEAAKQTGAWVVYASSSSVYGNAKHFPICEDDPVNLMSPYSASKYAGENYCQVYLGYGVPVIILRYSNVYGPGQRTVVGGVVARFVEAVLDDKPFQIHGNGSQTRDFVYIDDAVDATLKAAWSSRAVGQVFNIGTGIETDIYRLLAIVSGSAEFDGIEHIDNRNIDGIHRRVLNITKANQLLQWMPTVGLNEGVKMTLEWYKESNG